MAAIPKHTNVLPLVSFTETPAATLLALPLADGGDTLKFMQDRDCAALPEGDAHGLFAQLMSAVEHMHSNGFVHRDIKCENILLSGMRRRHVLLADFGFASRFVKGKKSLHESLGSLHYSSPEICSEVSYEGPEVDVWSMGVVLYAWVTGRLPFGGNTDDETRARICTSNFALPRHISPELANLITGMLEPSPAKRLTIAAIWQHPWMTTHASLNARRASSFIHSEPAPLPAPRRQSESNVKAPMRVTLLLRSIFRRK